MKGEAELEADRKVKKISQNMLVATSKALIVNDDAITIYFRPSALPTGS
jgi:hypothetical protein